MKRKVPPPSANQGITKRQKLSMFASGIYRVLEPVIHKEWLAPVTLSWRVLRTIEPGSLVNIVKIIEAGHLCSIWSPGEPVLGELKDGGFIPLYDSAIGKIYAIPHTPKDSSNAITTKLVSNLQNQDRNELKSLSQALHKSEVSQYVGVFWNRHSSLWASGGKVDGKYQKFATASSQEAAALLTREQCDLLRNSGKNVAENYGELKPEFDVLLEKSLLESKSKTVKCQLRNDFAVATLYETGILYVKSKTLKEQCVSGVESVVCTRSAFAAKQFDGILHVWGQGECISEYNKRRKEITDVEAISSTLKSFAARKRDGTVVVWGDTEFGGDSSIEEKLINVEFICSTDGAFAAKTSDGTVIVWGSKEYGGDPGLKAEFLVGIDCVCATDGAFAVRTRNGVVFAWGSAAHGGYPSNELENIDILVSNRVAFAAKKCDGTVRVWGDHLGFGNVDSKINELNDVVVVVGCQYAFAVRRKDGTTLCWGREIDFANAKKRLKKAPFQHWSLKSSKETASNKVESKGGEVQRNCNGDDFVTSLLSTKPKSKTLASLAWTESARQVLIISDADESSDDSIELDSSNRSSSPKTSKKYVKHPSMKEIGLPKILEWDEFVSETPEVDDISERPLLVGKRSAQIDNVNTKGQKPKSKCRTRGNVDTNRDVVNENATFDECEDEVYSVEQIIDKRDIDGSIEYLVSWVGFDSSWNTWEPAINLQEAAADAIADYEADQGENDVLEWESSTEDQDSKKESGSENDSQQKITTAPSSDSGPQTNPSPFPWNLSSLARISTSSPMRQEGKDEAKAREAKDKTKLLDKVSLEQKPKTKAKEITTPVLHSKEIKASSDAQITEKNKASAPVLSLDESRPTSASSTSESELRTLPTGKQKKTGPSLDDLPSENESDRDEDSQSIDDENSKSENSSKESESFTKRNAQKTTSKKSQSRRKSSYASVYWNKSTCKWQASLRHEKQSYYCGTYASEIEAAHAVNQKCDEMGISRRNADLGSPPSSDTSGSDTETGDEESSSESEDVQKKSKYRYIGIFQGKGGLWRAQGTVIKNGKSFRRFLAVGEDEETCKLKCLEKCKELEKQGFSLYSKYGHPRQITASGSDTEEDEESSSGESEDMQENKSRRKSSYVSVYFNKSTCKWMASLRHEKQSYYCGTYASEIEAAHAVNQKCDELGISRKNPDLGSPPSTDSSGSDIEEDDSESSSESEEAQTIEKTSSAAKQSSYVAVYWNKAGSKWRAKFNHAQQTYYCGTFHSELEAAHSINRKCDELGITRKNPSIGTPKNTPLKSYGKFEEEESSSTSEEMSEKNRKRMNFKAEPKFDVGQSVWCFYEDAVLGSKHYEATISCIHPDGTYDVDWNDGDFQNKFGHPESDILLPDDMTDEDDDCEQQKGDEVKSCEVKEAKDKGMFEQKSKQRGKGREAKKKAKTKMRADALAREAKEKEEQLLKAEKTRRAREIRSASAGILKRKQDKEYEARKRQQVLKTKPQLVPITLKIVETDYEGVTYNAGSRKWEVVMPDTMSISEYDSAKLAALELNTYCYRHNIPMPNPKLDLGDIDAKTRRKYGQERFKNMMKPVVDATMQSATLLRSPAISKTANLIKSPIPSRSANMEVPSDTGSDGNVFDRDETAFGNPVKSETTKKIEASFPAQRVDVEDPSDTGSDGSVMDHYVI